MFSRIRWARVISKKQKLISFLLLMLFGYLLVGFLISAIKKEVRKQFHSPHFFYQDPFDKKAAEQDGKVKYCSYENNVKGPMMVSDKTWDIQSLQKHLVSVQPGGKWEPKMTSCNASVAILVPYRDRAPQLLSLLSHLHPFLQKQNLKYQIFVVEQSSGILFNKGALINSGFLEIRPLKFDCIIIHDVDVLPEDDRIWYRCGSQPRHLAVAVNVWNYELIYKWIFGGALALTPEQFIRVNGFSNAFFGWGGEDDDFSYRIKYHGYDILRYPLDISRYKALPHKQAQHSPNKDFYLDNGEVRYDTDGLNSIKYKLIWKKVLPLYTHIMVEFDYDTVMDCVHSLKCSNVKKGL